MNKKYTVHPIAPFYLPNSEILILGSFPSVKSREEGFYYMHPSNRFWKVLSKVYKDELPESISKKKLFLEKHHIALWDVIESCVITGSSDNSISDIKVNDVSSLLKETNIKRIYTTGKKSYEIYIKHIYEQTKIEAIYLPSTSGANGFFSFSRLVEEYQILRGD